MKGNSFYIILVVAVLVAIGGIYWYKKSSSTKPAIHIPDGNTTTCKKIFTNQEVDVFIDQAGGSNYQTMPSNTPFGFLSDTTVVSNTHGTFYKKTFEGSDFFLLKSKSKLVNC